MGECNVKRGLESDDASSTITTYTKAGSEVTMGPPNIDWDLTPNIKTAHMSHIKSHLMNIYKRFSTLIQKMHEEYKGLRRKNDPSIRELQREYEQERKIKRKDTIRSIVRSLEEDGCAKFNNLM